MSACLCTVEGSVFMAGKLWHSVRNGGSGMGVWVLLGMMVVEGTMLGDGFGYMGKHQTSWGNVREGDDGLLGTKRRLRAIGIMVGMGCGLQDGE